MVLPAPMQALPLPSLMLAPACHLPRLTKVLLATSIAGQATDNLLSFSQI